MKLSTLAFDTGGSVLDWHGSPVAQARRLGTACGAQAGWHALVDTRRCLAMQGMVG